MFLQLSNKTGDNKLHKTQAS